MSDNLRVQYDRPETVYEMCDSLVDIDPIELRDLAQNLLADVETVKGRLAAAEQRGYDKAVANLRSPEGRSACARIMFRAIDDETLTGSVIVAAVADYLEAVRDQP